MAAESYAYPGTITQDEDGRFLVRFGDLVGAVTDGATLAEALTEASDALSEALLAAIEAGEDVPPPSRAKSDQVVIAPAPIVALKVALYMRNAGVRPRRQ
jgi:antitoxin HicB